MNLRHLKYFMAVAENLHFGKAAKKLFIAQPPLSRQIRQLEEELGVMLFDRDKRHVALTSQGAFLYDESQKIFNHLSAVRKTLGLMHQGVVGQINIGYVGAAMHCILPDLLVKLNSACPDVNAQLLELSTESQIQAIQTGQIDVGFIRTPVDIAGLIARSVYREPFSLVLPAEYEPVEATAAGIRALANEPFISFARVCGPGLIDSVLSICSKSGFAPRIVHETSQMNSVVRLVESGLGYSIVPSSVKNGYDLKVTFVELAGFEETAELSVVYAKGESTAIVQNFLAQVLHE